MAVAEIGGKMMSLSILSATRFKKPFPVIVGISATAIAFFVVEMNDQARVATIALGKQLAAKISLSTVHKIAAGMFLAMGLWQLWELSNPA